MDKPKTYKMLKTIQGSRDGISVETFAEGEIRDDIGPHLATQFYHQGAITEVGANAKANPAESRETKVSAPSESKEGEAGVDTSTQHIEELNSVARDRYGLETDTTMGRAELKDVVDEAGEGDNPDMPESEAEPLATRNATRGKKSKK